MADIRVDFPSGAFSSFMNDTLQKVTQTAIQSTMDVLYNEWTNIARSTLHTTYADYVGGLSKPYYPDFNIGIIEMKGKFAVMLEEGYSAFDMKKGFKNGKHVKQSKDGGWYQTIPYRHRTPNTAGTGAGGNAMPEDIYARARKELGELGRKRLTGTEGSYPAKTSWTGYQHKNGFYEGMVMNSKKYDKTTQNTYFTFRRVSDKSDPSSWWHSGFEGVKAFDRVKGKAQETFENNFNIAMAQMGGN